MGDTAEHQATEIGQPARSHDDQVNLAGGRGVDDGLGHVTRKRSVDLGLRLDPGGRHLGPDTFDELIGVGSILQLPQTSPPRYVLARVVDEHLAVRLLRDVDGDRHRLGRVL